MALDPGQVSQPVKTPYGFLVIQVTSRDVLKLTTDLQKTISVAILNAQGAPNDTINEIVARTRVKVNPAYGSWGGSQVLPPKTPGSSA